MGVQFWRVLRGMVVAGKRGFGSRYRTQEKLLPSHGQALASDDVFTLPKKPTSGINMFQVNIFRNHVGTQEGAAIPLK